MITVLLVAAALVAGALIGRHNPSLASAAAKLVATFKAEADAAIAKAEAKIHK